MKKFRPQQPDPFINKPADQETAKFGHLNAIIESMGLNSVVGGYGFTIDNTDPLNPILNCTCPCSGPQPLRITFDDIVNVPVADATSISDWNAFFGLPGNGNPFTSVIIVGNEVQLYGGSNITLAPALFTNNNAITIIDDANSIVEAGFISLTGCALLTTVKLNACLIFADEVCSVSDQLATFEATEATDFGEGCFNGCSLLQNISIPKAINIGDSCFLDTGALTDLYIPLCQNLGSTVGDDSVFNGSAMTSVSATLTVPIALSTCNSGNPDGDIQFINAQATIIYV